jgi:hypothetical protein
MLSAIDTARRRADSTVKPSSKSVEGLSEIDPTSDADALAAIERALSKASDDGRL